MCHHDLDNNEIHIYPPSDTLIMEDEIWTIYITLWRKAKLGAMDFKYLWTPTTPIDDPTSLEDIRVTALNENNDYHFRVKKNVPV